MTSAWPRSAVVLPALAALTALWLGLTAPATSPVSGPPPTAAVTTPATVTVPGAAVPDVDAPGRGRR